MWKACGNFNKWLEKRCCDAWMQKFVPTLRGEQCHRCWTCGGATWFFLVLRIWGNFLFFANFFIRGFECGLKIGYAEGFSLGDGVGSESRVFTLGGQETGSTLVAGAGVPVNFGGRRFLFWLCGNTGGYGKICKRGWDVLLCKIRAILLIEFFVASP